MLKLLMIVFISYINFLAADDELIILKEEPEIKLDEGLLDEATEKHELPLNYISEDFIIHDIDSEFMTTENKVERLEKFENDQIFLYFFATWAVNAKPDILELDQLIKKYRNNKINFILASEE